MNFPFFQTVVAEIGKRFRWVAFLFFISTPFITGICSAEDIVSYWVKTTSSSDWDLAVNGTTFVHHRPTGFGLSIYSGNLNRAVSNGVNVISFLKDDNTVSEDAITGNIDLTVDYIFDYQGQPSYERSVSLLHCEGFRETNLMFTVDGSVKRLLRGRSRVSKSEASMRLMVLVVSVFYLFFVNLYGFIMVMNDKRYAKMQQVRIPPARFLGNVLFGGGVGVVLGVVTQRHDLDRRFLFVFIPVLMIIQVVFIIWVCTADGKDLIGKGTSRKPSLRVPAVFNHAADFLNLIRKKDSVSY